MLEFHPTPYDKFACTHCNSPNPKIINVLFFGQAIMAECRCNKCGTTFYHTFPAGHYLWFPVSFTQKESQAHPRSNIWLVKPLLDSFFNEKKIYPNIKKEAFKKFDQTILLNCLDSCYGHVFHKMFNALLHLKNQPELGMILLIPKSFLWLVPEGVAEVWWVDTPLKNLNQWIDNLDDFVKQELKRFKKVYLSLAFTHLESTNLDLAAFTKTQKFELEKFDKLPPTITFICREDRFWINNYLENFVFLVAIKFNLLRYVRKYFIYRQSRLYTKTARKIAKRIKNVRFYAVGLGKTGQLGKNIIDHRHEGGVMTETQEKQWCTLYAQSHIVIGIHGSNMIIPTSLSAGFIELLPRHKIPHLTEDVAPSYAGRYRHFLGRFLDQFSSTRLLSLHAISMLTDFRYFYTNTDEKFTQPQILENIETLYGPYIYKGSHQK
jgi:hypothetical protein